MKTIIEKIWDSHLVENKEGFPDILAIDLQLVHEVTSPQAFQVLKGSVQFCLALLRNRPHVKFEIACK